MDFHIITIFPNSLDSYLNESIIKRAQDNGLIQIYIHNLRDYTHDKHKTVDDTPYGGGVGMVMKVEPIHKALCAINSQFSTLNCQKGKGSKNCSKTVLTSARGTRWNQSMAKKYAKYKNVVIICGRYEGVDERVKNFIDEEISIGDFVLTGGEIPALTMIDSITRLIPGVLGNVESSVDESHSQQGVLEYPQYTRPEIFKIDKKEYRVPNILLSGNHKEIKNWKEEKRRKNKL